MSVTITITGSDAAEAVKELSSLAKSFVTSTVNVVHTVPAALAETPKVEELKKPKTEPKPKVEPIVEKKVEEPKKLVGLSLPKDGAEREKAAIAFVKDAIADYDTKAAELALYPVEDQYTLIRQPAIELMNTGRKAAFDKANSDFGIKALKEISTDSPKMLTHFKTLIKLLSSAEGL